MRLADTSFDYALERLDQIGSQLRLFTDYSHLPELLSELKNIIQLLEYHCSPKLSSTPITEFYGPSVHCHADGCMKTWRDHDACLLNFAGKWLCREHHPQLKNGAINPPGYQPPASDRVALESARTAVRDKLSREEMRLINTRIGG